MIYVYLILWIVGTLGISMTTLAGRGKLTLRDLVAIAIGWGVFGIPLFAFLVVLGGMYVGVVGLNRVTLWKGRQR